MSVVLKHRICNTRKLKTQGSFPRATIHPASLFSGTAHFVNVSFSGISVSASDLNVTLQQATLSAPVISNYAKAYGPNTLNVSQTILSFTAPKSSYSDADLQNWIRSIVTANNIPVNDAIVIMNPRGATNTDAPLSQGVLGYHGTTGPNPYSFVNLEGSGLTVDDQADLYADALTHELAEMTVDPAADLSNSEVCDPCAGNCNVRYDNFFDKNRNWLGGQRVTGYAFFTNGVVLPKDANACPAPVASCSYAPPGTSPTPPPPTPSPTPPPPTPANPCIAQIDKGVLEVKAGNLVLGIEDIIGGIVCLFEHGYIKRSELKKAERLLRKG